jgi:hypothetical protein
MKVNIALILRVDIGTSMHVRLADDAVALSGSGSQGYMNR